MAEPIALDDPSVTGLKINKCKIYSAEKVLDFKDAVVEFNYYEDIFTNTVSGKLMINDSSGQHNQLSWCGDEFLELEIDKPERPDDDSIIPLRGIYKIYNIKNRHLGHDANENLILYFCTEEILITEKIRISKSYLKWKISDIVLDIARTFLKIPPSLFGPAGIEPTLGTHDIVIPKLKPLEAINWLATLAISEKYGPDAGAFYLFYRNRDGYSFRSLISIFDDIERFEYVNPIAAVKSGTSGKTGNNGWRSNYWYSWKNIDSQYYAKSGFSEYEQITSFTIMDSYDSLKQYQRGMFGNTLLSIDYIRRMHETAEFDYPTYWGYLNSKIELYKEKEYNNVPIMSTYTDRYGKKHNDHKETHIKIHASTTKLKDSDYVVEKIPDIEYKLNNRIENTIPYRFAQFALLGHNRLKVIVPGDPFISVGRLIYVNFPQATKEEGDGGDTPHDRFHTGWYLITCVRHKLDQENNFETILELLKDSYHTGILKEVGLKPIQHGDLSLNEANLTTEKTTSPIVAPNRRFSNPKFN